MLGVTLADHFHFIADKRSNRCISHMDHYCPWTNNVVGLHTQKHFLLFLIYTDLTALYLYVVFITRLVSSVSVSHKNTTIPGWAMVPYFLQT